MAKKSDPGGGMLRNSLSKLTGRVTLKAPTPEKPKESLMSTPQSPAKGAVPTDKKPTAEAPASLPKTPTPAQAPSKPTPTAEKAERPSKLPGMSKPESSKTAAKPAQPTPKPAPSPAPAATESKPAPALGSPTLGSPKPVSSPQSSPPDTAGANSLAEDVIIEGVLVFTDRLVFNGKITGEIKSDGVLTIKSDAVVDANLNVKTLYLEGKVTGIVIATEGVTLAPTAEVVGDVSTARLTVEPGAVIHGKTSVGATASKPTK